MRKILLLSCVYVFLFAGIAHAEGQIVVFDLQKVAAESEALAVAKKSMDDKFGSEKADLEKQRADLEKKAAEYQKKAPTDKQRQEFVKQQREYQEKAQAFVRLLQADEMRVRKDIDTLISRAAKALAERNGYTLILEAEAAPYFDPKLDITAAMLAETNAQWKKEAGGNTSGK